MSKIEPLARAITERVCRRTEGLNPASPRMTAVAAWVDAHWQCAAAELEASVMNDDGNRVPGADWEFGLAAYRERMSARYRWVPRPAAFRRNG